MHTPSPVHANKKWSLLAIIALLPFLHPIQAQQGWEAGAWIGAMNYFGDLNTEYRFDRVGFGFGTGARYNFNSRICFMLSANYGQVAGYDSDSDNSFERARNLHFESSILEGTAQLEFNFLPYIHGSKEQFFTPYLYTGLSVIRFRPEAEFNGEMVELQPLGTEGQFQGEEYSTTAGAFCVGGGFKMDLSYEWSINVSIGTRLLFTDYLDDVSTVYPDYIELSNLRGPTAVALADRSVAGDVAERTIGETGRQRGNSEDNDQYLFAKIGLMYYFGDLRCPTISRKF